MIRKVNLGEKFSQFSEYWSPKIVGEINDAHVKVVKLQGEFVWHHHDNEDELFLVVKGQLRMRYQEDGVEREMKIGPGEFVVIPRGTEHLPSAEEETHIVLLEPKSTLNTGNVLNERTVEELESI
jgi:mannose-6-phosphate isomerase-like protein (cupin superfamily)